VREFRFRFGADDRKELNETPKKWLPEETNSFLPVLFCSPTMELGVDISALNTVYLRISHHTGQLRSALWARRKIGSGCLVISYCAAQSPHDQHTSRSLRKWLAGL